MTADGKIDTFERRGAKISSEDDWKRVDRFRAECDAVMVGGRTLIEEDPRLTVKSQEFRNIRLANGLSENPTKVGVVSDAKFTSESHFIHNGPARRMIFTTKQTSHFQLQMLEEASVKVFILGEQRVDLAKMLQKLTTLGIQRLLVEGGGTLNSALIIDGLVDEIHIFIAPLIFGGVEAPTLADGLGLTRENAIQLKTKAVNLLEDGGILIRYLVLNS